MARVVIACVVAFWAAVAAAQEEVVVTLEGAQALAEQALRAGDVAAADRLSSLVLAREPGNARALLVRAAIARQVGALDDAAAFGAQAYAGAELAAVRFEAAFLVADVKARQERFLTSQFWLRRADQAAPDAARQEVVANAYRQVSRANPLSVQLRFGVQPSNNVNNGAEDDTVVLPFAGTETEFTVDEQLSGYEASLGASIRYRLSEDETQRTELLNELFYRKVWLDSQGKRKAPDATGSDFNFAVVVAGLRHSRAIWPELGVSRVTGLVGQSWFGDEALARWGEVQLGQDVRQGEDALLSFGLIARAESQLDRDSTTSDDSINSNHTLEARVDRVQVINDDRATYGLSVKNFWSDSPTVDSTAVTLRGGWDFGDVGAIRPRVNGSLERRVFHEFTSDPDGRRDTSLSLSVTAEVTSYSLYGFVPQVTLQGRRVWSSFDLYDRTSYSLGVTAVSRF